MKKILIFIILFSVTFVYGYEDADFVDYNWLGNKSFEKNDYEEALRCYTNAIDQEPGVSRGYENRAKAKEKLKDYKGALKDYSKAIEIDPKDVILYVKRREVEGKLGDEKGAKKDFRKIIKMDKLNARAYYKLLAQDQLNDRDPYGALESYSSAIEIDPSYAEAYLSRGDLYMRIKEPKLAKEDYAKAKKLSLEDTKDHFYREGLRYQSSEYYQEAIEAYLKAIDADPKYEMALNFRGDCKIKIKDLDGAIKDFERTVRINPKNQAAYFGLGRVANLQNDYKKSIEYFAQAISVIESTVTVNFLEFQSYKNNHVDAYIYRAMAKYNLKDFSGAEKDFKSALELDPEDHHIMENLAMAYHEIGDHENAVNYLTRAIRKGYGNIKNYQYRAFSRASIGDNLGAIEDYNKALEMDPNNYSLLTSLANTYLKQKEFQKALDLCDKIIKTNSQKFEPYFARSYAKYMLKNYQGSMEDCLNALSLNPNYGDIYLLIGNIKFKLSDYNEAIINYSKAIELMDKNNNNAYFHRGECYYKQGKFSEALADFNKAIEAKGNSSNAYKLRGEVKNQMRDILGAENDYKKSKELGQSDQDYSILN